LFLRALVAEILFWYFGVRPEFGRIWRIWGEFGARIWGNWGVGWGEIGQFDSKKGQNTVNNPFNEYLTNTYPFE